MKVLEFTGLPNHSLSKTTTITRLFLQIFSYLIIVFTLTSKIIFGYTTFIAFAKVPPIIYVAGGFVLYLVSSTNFSSFSQFKDVKSSSPTNKRPILYILFPLAPLIYSVLFFSVRKDGNLFFQGLDGEYQKVNSLNSNIFESPLTYNSFETLQGLGSEGPFNYRYGLDFGYWLLNLNENFGISLSHCFWATTLFLSLFLFMSLFKIGFAQNYIVSFVTPLYLLVPSGISTSFIPQLTPHLVLTMSLYILILYFLLHDKNNFRQACIYSFLTILNLVYFVLLNPTFILIFGFPIAFCAIIVMVSKFRSKNSLKFEFVYLAIVLIASLILRIPFYLLGQVKDSSVYYYEEDYSWGGPILIKHASSIFLERRGAAIVYVLTFLFCLIWAIKSSNFNLKVFSIFLGLYMALIFVFGLVWLRSPESWVGIRPVYFEMAVWPFLIPLILVFLGRIFINHKILRLKFHEFFGRIFGIESLVLVIFLLNTISFSFNEYANPRDQVSKRSEKISLGLLDTLKLTSLPGDFNGRFALIVPEYPEKNFSNFLDEFELKFGFQPWRNDLWAEQIPTLNQYGQLISKRSYFLIKNSFSAVDDVQVRNSINISRYNNLLSVIGVRFFIIESSKIVVDQNVQVLNEFEILDTKFTFAELKNTNLGNLSPIKQEILPDFKSSFELRENIDRMLDGVFFTITDVVKGAKLAPAKDIKFSYKDNAYTLQAQSSQQSVIILPLEYSGCLKFINSSDGARFFEANWGLTGVYFKNQISVKILYENGLFNSPTCKFS